MIVRVKRQKGPNDSPYWQSFEYNGKLDVTVVAVINFINYSNDIKEIDGNKVDRIRWAQ